MEEKFMDKLKTIVEEQKEIAEDVISNNEEIANEEAVDAEVIEDGKYEHPSEHLLHGMSMTNGFGGLFDSIPGLGGMFGENGKIDPNKIEEIASNIKYGTHFTLVRSVFEKFDSEFSSIIENIVMEAGVEFNEVLFNCPSIVKLQEYAAREVLKNSTFKTGKVENTATRMYTGYQLLNTFFKGNKEKMIDFIEVYRRDVYEEANQKWNMSTDGALGPAITMLCEEIKDTALSVLFLYEKWIRLELNKKNEGDDYAKED